MEMISNDYPQLSNLPTRSQINQMNDVVMESVASECSLGMERLRQRTAHDLQFSYSRDPCKSELFVAQKR